MPTVRVPIHLAQEGRRCTLVVQRATLLRPALEDGAMTLAAYSRRRPA